MTPSTPNEKLNFVLEYINQERPYTDLHREIDSHANMKGQFSPGEIDLIMDKLREDSYVDYVAGQKINKDMRASDGLNLRRNFNGTVFITKGGYIDKDLRESKARALRDKLDKRLSNGTVLLAVGTFLIVAWEMIKTFCIEHH